MVQRNKMAKEKTENQLIVNPGDLGLRLVEYREKAGFSLVQMADALCLPEDTIRKLEEEDFETLAEPPYIRGYLRNYAKIADTDPDELIHSYEALRGADPSELDYHLKTSSKIRTSSPRKISPVVGQLFFLALLISVLVGLSMIPGINKWITETWNSFSEQTSSLETPSSDNPLLTGNMPVPTPLPINQEAAAQLANNTGFPPSSTSENKTNATETTTNNNPNISSEDSAAKENATANSTSTDPKPEDQVKALAEQDPTPTTTGSDVISVKLVFNKEVWMRIRDKDNKTLFEATNSAGKEKVLELKKPLTFRVGNAQGLSLFVDNKPVDINGYIKGAVANFTLK